MTAHEILTELLEGFRQSAPEIDFRETYGPENAGRLLVRPAVTGEVAKEVTEGEGWNAKLAFLLYMPRGAGADEAEDILAAMTAYAVESQPLLASVQRGATGVDKSTGSVTVSLTLSFAKPEDDSQGSESGSTGGSKTRYTIYIDGTEYSVTGWKAAYSESGSSLTAIGEDVPFSRKTRREYSVELQGLDITGLEALDGFTLRLGQQEQVYAGCRWKSLSAAGTGVLTATERWEG